MDTISGSLYLSIVGGPCARILKKLPRDSDRVRTVVTAGSPSCVCILFIFLRPAFGTLLCSIKSALDFLILELKCTLDLKSS
nr:unnamed protein product [Callosobruchus chinensis]